MSYSVKDYMEKDVPTIVDTVTVTEAAKAISERGKGFLVVLRGGMPSGIVTEEDFVKKVMACELDPKTLSVGQIMSSPLITVGPDKDLLKTSQLMKEHNVRRLPVVMEGIIYGVITAMDIATHCGTYVDKSVRISYGEPPHSAYNSSTRQGTRALRL
jgi:CBS domain-containing protein